MVGDVERRKKRFSDPHFYVSKMVMSLRLPMDKCLDLIDVNFTMKQDQTVKELYVVEELGPENSICYCRTKTGVRGLVWLSCFSWGTGTFAFSGQQSSRMGS